MIKKLRYLFVPAAILLVVSSFKLMPGVVVSPSSALWMRYPAISPDGKTIVFEFKGDIYKMASTGGNATVLTLSDGYDFSPVWSPDGKTIAFASDRYGNYDIFTMPAEGGTAKRLTYYSTNDIPYCFSPDGKTIQFSSARMDGAKTITFPSAALPEVYSVSVDGGREKQEFSIAAEWLNWNKAGDKMLFQDKKGYEDQWRKHHTSSIARDIWMYNKKDNKYTQLTTFAGEDRNPVWSKDEADVFYLSEKSGSLNVWKMNVANPSNQTQITKFDKNPVRFLSTSNDGTLCFGYNGEIYTKYATGEPVKLTVNITTDDRYKESTTEIMTSGVTDMDASADGKEVVFVVRGEVFVSSVESGVTKRITNTPEQERNVSFSPDGKSILYASERGNIWGLYETKLTRKEENHFFNSTIIKEEPLVVGTTEAFQPKYSPDGLEVAFLEERTAVKVINLKTKQSRTILPADRNYSYSDGDQWFDWSPDGKYLLVQYLQDGNWLGNIGLIESSGKGSVVNLTKSGFDNGNGKWQCNGKMMLYFTNRNGMRNWGPQGGEADAYGLFFTQAAFDKFKMSKEEFAEQKDADEKAEKAKTDATKADKKKDDKKKDEKPKIDTTKIELDGIENRKARLTMNSSDLADAIMSNDGEAIYYLCKFDKGYDLWVNKFKEHETKMLLRLDAGSAGGMKMDKEGKNLFLIADGGIVKITLDSKERKDVSFSAEMNLNTAAERAYLFEHMWRQVVKKFYVTDLQKTDWNYYKTNYSRFLPFINNDRDFAEMCSEMLGELNASHTGCRVNPRFKNPDETACLGVFYDETYTGSGMKIGEVIEKSPLVQASSKIKAGTVIEKIDGNTIDNSTNIYQLLNRKAGKYTLLSLYDESTKKRWEETVKPISIGAQSELLYQRWITWMEKETDRISGGKIGYVHVRGMSDQGYRDFYETVLGKCANAKALIVDTRFNGGGWLHDDLATFLSGKRYLDFVPREKVIGFEPQTKWTKPSCVLMNEGNYSDAYMFPMVYKTLNIGKLVGMPVAGTGTAVWWETLQNSQLVFGIPEVGIKTLDGKYYENLQIEPDYKVMNDYILSTSGKDQQLEKCVEILMK